MVRKVSHDPSPNHASVNLRSVVPHALSHPYATPARANSPAQPTTWTLDNRAMISSTSQGFVPTPHFGLALDARHWDAAKLQFGYDLEVFFLNLQGWGDVT
jgi:hypothetical protein